MVREEELYKLIHVTPLDTGQTSPTAPKMSSQPLLKRLKSITDFSIISKCRYKQGLKSLGSPFTWVPAAEKSRFIEPWNVLTWKGTCHKDYQSPTPAEEFSS